MRRGARANACRVDIVKVKGLSYVVLGEVGERAWVSSEVLQAIALLPSGV